MEELRDLLLPFRLQRRRRHHQHPLDAVQLAQQGAGGDGLRGLAEPHVVGKQRPFAEREVQHAFGLVRQERTLEQAVQRPAAGLQIRLETGAGALPSHRRLPGFQPVFQAAGNAEAILAGTRRVPERPERPGRAAAQVPVQPPDLGGERRVFARHPGGDHHARLPIALPEKDLDAIARPALPADADAPHRALDVLAGAEAVGGEVTAPAGVDPLLERSDLHHVAAAARRRHPVVAERTTVPVKSVHFADLGPAAPFPPLDLVLVRRNPSPEHGTAFGPVFVFAGGFLSRFTHAVLPSVRGEDARPKVNVRLAGGYLKGSDRVIRAPGGCTGAPSGEVRSG